MTKVPKKVVLDSDAIARTLYRIAHEIVEGNAGANLSIVGIQTRGVPLANRLHRLVSELMNEQVELGDIDISFYRDDIGSDRPEGPVVHASHLDFSIDGATVVIVDDVLYTGRTVRAAIDALFDYGRPGAVRLATLIDRGHRELPIRPDYVGKNLPTSQSERVNVRLVETDGTDEVNIAQLDGAAH